MINFKNLLSVFVFFIAINSFSQQNTIEQITTKNGLPSNIVFDIQQDKIGYVWLATNSGLVQFDGDDFKQLSTEKVSNLLVIKNDVYAGLENGLLVFKKNTKSFYKSKKVIKIVTFNNDIYVGTLEGIYLFKNDVLQPLEIETTLDFSIINDLIFIKNSFYIASNKGLFKIDDLQNPTNISKISDEEIVSLTTFQNQVIAANSFNKILVFEGEVIVKTFESLTAISSVKSIKNNLWVASKNNGLEIFSLPSFSFKQKINKYNSLQTNTIYTVFKSDENTIYIGTNKGIYFIKSDDLKTEKQPEIYIENLQINHQNKDSLLMLENVKLAPSQNNISLTFKTVSLLNPKKINYRYKLTDEFSPWFSNNSVEFANLKAGKYTFQVQSKIDNVESKISSFSFTIDAPFYLKTWFILMLFVVLLSISYFGLDFYIKKIKKVNNEKLNRLKQENYVLTLEQKALQLQMNPHFIFNVLNGIKALGNLGNTIELNKTISQFSVLLRSVLNNSRLTEISLQEEIETLKNYLELEQKMNGKAIFFSIKTDLNSIDLEEILIPPMLVQPFVENCIKHAFHPTSKNGKININFSVKHRFLECVVLDNGIGIYESQKHKKSSNHISVALKVTKERIENLSKNSTIKISELKENNQVLGTKVWFKIPLKTDF